MEIEICFSTICSGEQKHVLRRGEFEFSVSRKPTIAQMEVLAVWQENGEKNEENEEKLRGLPSRFMRAHGVGRPKEE